jgi:hypothetical protein
MKILWLYLVAIKAILVGFLFSQTGSSLNGTFKNDQILLSLSGNQGCYTGQVQFEGQSFPLNAQSMDGKKLNGSYSYYGEMIPFQATFGNNTLTIYSDGESYTLVKQGSELSIGTGSGSNENLGATAYSSNEAPLIQNDEWGIKFLPPDSWNARKTESGYLLTSSLKKGLIVVIPNEHKDLQTMRSLASQGLNDEHGTALRLIGTVEAFGQNGLKGAFEGKLEGQQAKAYVVSLISSHGPGATILAAAEPKSFNDTYHKDVQQLAESVYFYKSPTPPIVLE